MKEKVVKRSEEIWEALGAENFEKVREIVDENATFVHMGMTVDREGEIAAYENGHIKPGPVQFNNRDVKIFGDTATCATDVNVTAYVDGKEAIHHFLVTEVYKLDDDCKLIAFVFTALRY